MGESVKKKAFGRREIITLVCLFTFFGFLAWVAVPNFNGEPITKSSNACINNLRQIEGAKQQWAVENAITNGNMIVTENDILPLLGRGFKGGFSQCPSGGKYTIGKPNEPATCSLGTNVNPPHILPSASF